MIAVLDFLTQYAAVLALIISATALFLSFIPAHRQVNLGKKQLAEATRQRISADAAALVANAASEEAKRARDEAQRTLDELRNVVKLIAEAGRSTHGLLAESSDSA